MPFACKGHGPEMSAVVNYGVALAKISLKAFRRPGGGMSPNRGVYFQKARSPARLRVSVAAQLAADNARTVKMRAGEMSVWNISPPWRAFPCGKNGISLLKEISFLPQRRKFLAAKKFSGVWKAGKNGASGGFFLLIGGRRRAKSNCPFASLSPHGLTRGRRPSARRPVADGKVSRESGFRLSSCISGTVRESRISARPRPCARPRDSRGGGFDVLTIFKTSCFPRSP